MGAKLEATTKLLSDVFADDPSLAKGLIAILSPCAHQFLSILLTDKAQAEGILKTSGR